MKIDKAIELYWLEKKLVFSSATVRTYTHTFKYLIEFFPEKEIETVTYSDILSFINHLKNVKKLSDRTAHDAVSIISSLWTYLKLEIDLKHIFEKRKLKIAFTEKLIVPFTEDDIAKLLKACETTEFNRDDENIVIHRSTELLDKALILTLLDSGARIGEVLNWKVSDYDSKTGKLFIGKAKRNKQRVVIIGLKTQKALFKYLNDRDNATDDAPLFASRNNTKLAQTNIRRKLTDLGNKAGVKNVHPHKFRHTFAINRLRNGDNVFRLKELLGHSNLEMTMKYARIAQIDIDKANEHSVVDKWKLK